MPKKSLPLSKVYQLIEPGPVVLLTTASGEHTDIMTMSWHTMLEFEPPLIGCVISNLNHSYALLKSSKECVINIPTEEMAKKVIACGNSTGIKTDKFKRYGLTRNPAELVSAPLIAECFANLECRVVDTSMLKKYSFFVLEVVQAWIAPSLKNPKTMHHRGYGRFMIAGDTIKLRSKMR